MPTGRVEFHFSKPQEDLAREDTVFTKKKIEV
jgi:hypothetical protein